MRRLGAAAAVVIGLAGLSAPPLSCSGDAAWPALGQEIGSEARDGAGAMRIEFESDGGLAYMPGLARPVTIELDQLPEAEAREIRDLVAATRFFDRPAQAGGPPARGAADQRSHTLTVTQGATRHAVTVTEPIEDEDLRRLVRLIETQARAARRRGAAGQPP